MNRKLPLGLCCFLILLRLAIGWHFFYEGWSKVQTRYKWEKGNPKRWSSAPFLRESQGPVADVILQQVGNPNENALQRLTLKKDNQVSDALTSYWNGYLNRFAAHYELNDEQKKAAETALAAAKEQAALWLQGKELNDAYHLNVSDPAEDKDPEKDPNPYFEVDVALVSGSKQLEMRVPQRIIELREKLDEIKQIQSSENFLFGGPVRSDLPLLRSEARQMRDQLTSSLDKILTNRLQHSVGTGNNKLTSEQQGKASIKGAVPPPEPTRIVRVSDWLVPYGLTVIGAALFLGAFTRLFALMGALFLIMVYVSLPGVPWIEVPRAEGNYLYVNKNVVELLGLLVLASAPSGRWLGLDAILQHLSPFRRKQKDAAQSTR